MNKKVYLIIIGVIVTLVGVSALVWRNQQDEKVEESKAEVASLEDRTVAPTPVTSQQEDLRDESNFPQEPEPSTPVPTNNEEVDTTPLPEPDPLPAPEQNTNEPVNQGPSTLASAGLTGVGSYRVSGSSSIIDNNGQLSLNFGEDFEFSGAPDPVIYMCQDKAPDNISNCLIIGALGSDRGAQAYSLTASEYSTYPNPIIWCRAFGLLMGHTT